MYDVWSALGPHSAMAPGAAWAVGEVHFLKWQLKFVWPILRKGWISAQLYCSLFLLLIHSKAANKSPQQSLPPPHAQATSQLFASYPQSGKHHIPTEIRGSVPILWSPIYLIFPFSNEDCAWYMLMSQPTSQSTTLVLCMCLSSVLGPGQLIFSSWNIMYLLMNSQAQSKASLSSVR